ncbi:MAG TPA: trehalose-6-phosphate synthase [Bdellovibrionales bacterium]|nr:trehalose-6-phosphate synthase [Bdellovibrionales bacterium]
MRLSLRFVLPLLLVLGLVAYSVIPLVDQLTLRWFSRDLDLRTQLIAGSVHDTLASYVNEGSSAKVTKLFNRMVQDQRLFALGFCDQSKKLVFKTQTYPETLGCSGVPDGPEAHQSASEDASGQMHISFQPIHSDDKHLGHLVLIHDMSFVVRRSEDTKRFIFYLFALLALIISALTVVIAQLSWKGWVNGIRSLIRGEGILKPMAGQLGAELRPIAKDLRALVRDLEADRKARDESQTTWNPRTLKDILRRDLAGDEVLIVSNRQPYIHTWRDNKIEIQLPASGLVTALEPIMRACSGTWIAHGSGSADRDVVDNRDHVRVPPDNPSYQIRRVWLTKEEEQGYYYGFSNEGLWPLCHIAHTRPLFRAEDWKQYQAVNEKFARAVVEEAKTDDPVILVQDYHFALLPRLVKRALPKATIITFWHIPWPNPEAFGICPWRDEILDGMLGSDILGFHTRFHCNNFIDTVDRFIESRIDRETSTISYKGELTAVNHYPISIEWPNKWMDAQKPVGECREKIRKANNFRADVKIGVGIDRLDYTKGILERFMAVERFLELNPEWVGRFTFIQIAAPSRSSIEQYQQFESQVRTLARKINTRFSREGYNPIELKIEHHGPEQVFENFRAADVCFVSSLHDGMNLVAKEYVASRDDERGVLILSQFTGASRELPQALIVNPYDIDQCATAIKMALEMPVGEQRDRMKTMRGLIQEFNVYRWAGRMLVDASRLRKHNRFVGRFGDSKSLLRPVREI